MVDFVATNARIISIDYQLISAKVLKLPRNKFWLKPHAIFDFINGLKPISIDHYKIDFTQPAIF